MTLDGFVKEAQAERVGMPQRVERASEARDAAETFMRQFGTILDVEQNIAGSRASWNHLQTPFVRLKDGNDVAIRFMLGKPEGKQYQLVAKTEDASEPGYAGEVYAYVLSEKGDTTIEYAPGVDVSDMEVALANDDEVVKVFGEITDSLRREYPDFLPQEQPALVAS